MTWARSWAWLVALAVTLSPALAFARVPTRLVYVRAPSAVDCPDEAALGKAVAARLGYDPFSPWGDQTILATVAREGDELLGRAELVDHDGISQGRREVRLAHRDCAELLLTLSLAISITLDPLYIERAPEAAVEPPVPEEEPIDVPAALPSEPAPPVGRDPKPAPVPSATTTWHLNAAVQGSVQTAPGLAMGGRVGIAANRSRWGLGVEVSGFLPRTRAHANGGEASVRLTSLAVTPCLRVLVPLSLCGLASLGLMHAEGSGVEEPRTGDILFPTLGVRAAFGLPLGSRFELFASVDLAAALNRPRFQLNASDVWRPGPMVAQGAIGVAARFF
ncbi:MAG: hypothetical protein K0R38_312 [Polyangiaceae bacterium]|jgi:hypothetical protein|nr:hypothetical protein [Polyangiaceae bacterium]